MSCQRGLEARTLCLSESVEGPPGADPVPGTVPSLQLVDDSW